MYVQSSGDTEVFCFVEELFVILVPEFQRRYARMFLEVLAEERGVGEFQVVGYLLHRHVGEAQTALDGSHREVLYHHAGSAIDRLSAGCLNRSLA